MVNRSEKLSEFVESQRFKFVLGMILRNSETPRSLTRPKVSGEVVRNDSSVSTKVSLDTSTQIEEPMLNSILR